MNAIERSVRSLSISARTSAVNGFTRSSGPPAFCCMIQGPFSIRALSGTLRECVCVISAVVTASFHEVFGGMPIELIEAMRGRQTLWFFSEVPLAEDCRRVARVFEQLSH